MSVSERLRRSVRTQEGRAPGEAHPRHDLESTELRAMVADVVERPEAGRALRSHIADWLALLRVAIGFVFLWAFLDKLFGFGYSTPAGQGWIDGGSPTKGYLSGVSAGPLESTFHTWAGDAWADWLFMIGLAAIGVAVVCGVALRLAALGGTALLALMWIAEWPPAKHTSAGDPTMSTNPFVDYHVVYALVLIVLAVAHAGNRWGFGRMWARLPIVRSNRAILQ